ncbi:MAG: hypothetical protein KGH94_04795 [Candidatus Micrarchaeota archaeon]|nr:hypothetical protein [Candidatus Micrarchaeota archaeon]
MLFRSNSGAVRKNDMGSEAHQAMRRELRWYMRKRLPDQAANVAERMGDIKLSMRIRRMVGDHGEIVRLMLREDETSEAVSYLDKIGKPINAVRLAMENGLVRQAKYIVTKEVFLSKGSKNLDYTPQLADMAMSVGFESVAWAIASSGSAYFTKVKDFYSKAVLNFTVGNIERVEEALNEGLKFYSNGSEEGKRIRALAKELTARTGLGHIKVEELLPTTTSSSILTPPKPSM